MALCKTYIWGNNKELQNLISSVIEQINDDINEDYYESLYELLTFIPKDNLVNYLDEDKQKQFITY